MKLEVDDGTLIIPQSILGCRSAEGRACWQGPTQDHGPENWTREQVEALEECLCVECRDALARATP